MSSIIDTYCLGDSIVVDDVTYNNANPNGTQIIEGGSSTGCDSIVMVDLSFFAAATGQYTPTFCADEDETINGTVYDSNNLTGIEIFENQAANGCDSILEVSVLILEETFGTDTQGLCPGDSIFLAGAWQFAAGDYIDTLINAASCDSILTTTVIEQNCGFVVELEGTDVICAGDSTGFIEINIGAGLEAPFTIRVVGQSNGDIQSFDFTMVTPFVLVLRLHKGSYAPIWIWGQ